MDDDDDAAWEGWEVESDSSSESEGWNDVLSDDGDIVISDSDDDRPKSKGKKVQPADEDEDIKPEDAATPAATEVSLVSNLATTKVGALVRPQYVSCVLTCSTRSSPQPTLRC